MEINIKLNVEHADLLRALQMISNNDPKRASFAIEEYFTKPVDIDMSLIPSPMERNFHLTGLSAVLITLQCEMEEARKPKIITLDEAT